MTANVEPAHAARREAMRAWLAVDPDPVTRRKLVSLMADDPEGADALFGGRISFGTAGLRAAIGPGPTRMNRVVVRQTTAGLARWLGRRSGTGVVVIGFDARHYSEVFAGDAAAELAAAGFRVELLAGPTPTPVLAHAVLDRSAVAGIMITASHNPPADNGYKLYLDDGIQLVGPADGEIAAAIDDVAADHARAGRRVLDDLGSPAEIDGDEFDAIRSRSVTAVVGTDTERPGSIVELDDTPQLRHRRAATAALLTDHRDAQVVYTAMHGVGGRHLLECFRDAGFPEPVVVAEQFEPDPDFPTTAFPNPEETGALDLAFSTAAVADRGGRTPDVVLANDPDADRLAVATADESGRWRRLTGDEVGALLVDHVFRHRSGATEPVVASSIVSSRLIDHMAEANGATSVRTLTGFKWVARPIVDRPGATYLLGYEEALGYCIGDRVRDKDGISAALVVAEIVAELTSQGLTVRDRLDRIAADFGLFATRQVTVSFDGLSVDEQAALKDRGTTLTPADIAGIAVAEVEDLAQGRHLPPTAGVVIDLEDRSRVIVRPSGTEPKMKAYIEVIEQVVDGNVTSSREQADRRLDALSAAVNRLLQP